MMFYTSGHPLPAGIRISMAVNRISGMLPHYPVPG